VTAVPTSGSTVEWARGLPAERLAELLDELAGVGHTVARWSSPTMTGARRAVLLAEAARRLRLPTPETPDRSTTTDTRRPDQ
jgi:hypothetical protein